MMEILQQILDTTINSFDFSFCITVNVLTYLIIKCLDDINGKKKVSRIIKRIVLLISILIVACVYYLIDDSNSKLILNSAIIAPVSWSWIFKPLLKHFGLDYKNLKELD